MSVKVQALVYSVRIGDLPWKSEKPRGKKGHQRTDFVAKASTVKLLLLAYADHSNDDGISAYPGYELLEEKTELSRQGIADTLNAIKQNGLMKFVGTSPRGTNEYAINIVGLKQLKEIQELEFEKGTESSHLTRWSQATGLGRVKSLDLNHPLNHPLTSSTTYARDETKFSQLVRAMESITGAVNTATVNFLDGLLQDWYEHITKIPSGHPNKKIDPYQAVLSAIQEGIASADRGRPNHKYIRSILTRWMADGYLSEIQKKQGRNHANKSTVTKQIRRNTQPDEATRRVAERINARRAAEAASLP